jgi:Tfp pilus assembly protein PilF
VTLGAQSDMKKGFTLLENGNFEAAEAYFEDVLKIRPMDKTAQICYGRAVGLSGEPKKATALFATLLETHPNDVEVALNYSESFLWDKKYEEAKPLYEKMVAEHPDRFGAVLGYANTLSNLKEYEESLKWIEKARQLQPENQSAKVSRKYMRLGYANELINKQDYNSGEVFLKSIFEDFPEDKEALLNLANLYLITKQTDSAKAIYRRYATSPIDSVTALNGISLAEHIAENDKAALDVATTAKNKVAGLNDSELTERTYDRYVQALIWNRKFRKAKARIDSLETYHPDQNWILALKATLGLYTGDAMASIENYDAILAKYSTSFDGNLGKANALFAADRIIPAYQAAYRTLEIYDNQKDALDFIEKLNGIYTPSIKGRAGYTFDNGNNVAYYTNTTADVALSTKFRTTVSYQYRSTENTVTRNQASSHVALVGLQYKLMPKTGLTTVVGLNHSRFMTEAYTQPVLDAQLQLQPLQLHNLNLGYQREVQNFNADLIEREIVQNHYGLNYNLGTNFNLGWYTQLMHTQQSDANTRNLLFTSLYYKVTQKPALKLGVNYQYISFAEQLPTIYFSPEQYQAVELFTDARGQFSNKTGYMASAAAGFQQVESDSNIPIFRAEAKLSQQFGKRLRGNLYGKYSNIASATAAGFEFAEVGLQLKWLFWNGPFFNVNKD